MNIKLLHAGFDTIEVSFTGALPEATLAEFRKAKEQARKEQQDQLVTTANGKVTGTIRQSGLSGGYAFMIDTGPDGELWYFKDNISHAEWNISVKLHASALAYLTYEEARHQLLQRLNDMDCVFGQESVRRVDFAFDLLMPLEFELRHDRFVTHYKT